MSIEIVKTCKKHGDLTELQVKREKNGLGYPSLRCGQCKIEKDQRYREKNRKELISKNMEYKKNNRHVVNEWNKKDRKENPEKYRKYEANFIAKHGIEYVRKKEVARIHGLTIKQYDELHERQEGVCEICKKPEKRLSRTKKEVMPLCLDHCHECKDKGQHIIRGLLCHNCNSAMGKLNDDIDILKSMVSYLEKHSHIKDDSTGIIHE